MINPKLLRFAMRHLVRIYAAVFVIGLYAGYSGPVAMDFPIRPNIGTPGSSSIATVVIHEINWAFGGMLFGALLFGLGPVIFLLFLGSVSGEALLAYLSKADTALYFQQEKILLEIGKQLAEVSSGLLESMAFLYGAVAGAYISLYYVEVYNDEPNPASRKNALIKLGEGIFFGVLAAGVRLFSI